MRHLEAHRTPRMIHFLARVLLRRRWERWEKLEEVEEIAEPGRKAHRALAVDGAAVRLPPFRSFTCFCLGRAKAQSSFLVLIRLRAYAVSPVALDTACKWKAVTIFLAKTSWM